MRAWIGSLAIAILIALAASGTATADTGNASFVAKWYAAAVVKFTLTPNYSSGYGTVKAVFGAQPTPNPGSGACLQGCAIDFGNVLSGTDYLYKYAAHLQIQTNDVNGVNIYGEGAADFTNTADNSTQSLNQTVYYLSSVASGDANTGYSSSLPFYRTTGTVSGNSFATAPTIAYATYPAPVANTASAATADLYYDYQLKVPGAATGGQYYVWIVYTVVAK